MQFDEEANVEKKKEITSDEKLCCWLHSVVFVRGGEEEEFLQLWMFTCQRLSFVFTVVFRRLQMCGPCGTGS